MVCDMCGGGGGRREEEPGIQNQNKNPTQSCGEKPDQTKQGEMSNFLQQTASWRNRNQQFQSQVRAVDQTAYPLQTSVGSLATDWWMEPWRPC